MDLILNNLETDEAFLTGAFEFSVRATSGHGDLIFNEAFGGPLRGQYSQPHFIVERATQRQR
jgi:hypothetical protein